VSSKCLALIIQFTLVWTWNQPYNTYNLLVKYDFKSSYLLLVGTVNETNM